MNRMQIKQGRNIRGEGEVPYKGASKILLLETFVYKIDSCVLRSLYKSCSHGSKFAGNLFASIAAHEKDSSNLLNKNGYFSYS